MDTMGTGVPHNTPFPSGQGKEQRQPKEGSKEMQHTKSTEPIDSRHLCTSRSMQKTVRILPRAWTTFPSETSEHETTASKGAGRQGSFSEN
jgi:hypothetical protein